MTESTPKPDIQHRFSVRAADGTEVTSCGIESMAEAVASDCQAVRPEHGPYSVVDTLGD